VALLAPIGQIGIETEYAEPTVRGQEQIAINRLHFGPRARLVVRWEPRRVHLESKSVYNLYWKGWSGAGADELLLESDQAKTPTDWSFDGRFASSETQPDAHTRAMVLLNFFDEVRRRSR
jgi:hypothetical protein